MSARVCARGMRSLGSPKRLQNGGFSHLLCCVARAAEMRTAAAMTGTHMTDGLMGSPHAPALARHLTHAQMVAVAGAHSRSGWFQHPAQLSAPRPQRACVSVRRRQRASFPPAHGGRPCHASQPSPARLAQSASPCPCRNHTLQYLIAKSQQVCVLKQNSCSYPARCIFKTHRVQGTA